MIKDDIMNMSPNDCIELFEKQYAEINRLNKLIEKLGKKCNKYQKKLTVLHFDGEENIPRKNKKHSKITHRQFAGFKGIGYYALIKNDEFIIGEERVREGGILYRGEYKGADTPYINDIKNENLKLYNSIINYFGYI